MPFDPHDFLALARDLVRQADAGEAVYRTAVSRAYYAVHLHARERLAASGEVRPTFGGGDHRLVVRALRARGAAEGDKLDRLRISRLQADYQIDREVAAVQGYEAVALAENIWPRI